MPKIRGIKPDYWTDEDIVELSIAARLLFIGLWNLACDNGHVVDKPKQIKIRILPGDDVDVDALLNEIQSHGRIVRADGTITIKNFVKHQKPHKRWWATCDLPLCLLPEGASHQPDSRVATVAQPLRTVDHGGATADVDGEGDGDVDLKISSEVADATSDAHREDVARICQHLAERIVSNGSKRPRVTKKWRDEARLLLDVDGRTEEQVHKAIDWCQTNVFWRSNVLSMPTLREKYDQLRLSAEREVTQRQRSPGGIDLDAAMARAQARDAQKELSA